MIYKMATIKNFEDLKIWKNATIITKLVYRILHQSRISDLRIRSIVLLCPHGIRAFMN